MRQKGCRGRSAPCKAHNERNDPLMGKVDPSQPVAGRYQDILLNQLDGFKMRAEQLKFRLWQGGQETIGRVGNRVHCKLRLKSGGSSLGLSVIGALGDGPTMQPA